MKNTLIPHIGINSKRCIFLELKIEEKEKRVSHKPGSVDSCEPGNHSSGIAVANYLKQPTRIRRGSRLWDSYLVLLRTGFALPQTVASCAVRSYRTLSPLPAPPERRAGGLLSAALSVRSHAPAVSRRSTLWSPDFPLQCQGIAAAAWLTRCKE